MRQEFFKRGGNAMQYLLAKYPDIFRTRNQVETADQFLTNKERKGLKPLEGTRMEQCKFITCDVSRNGKLKGICFLCKDNKINKKKARNDNE